MSLRERLRQMIRAVWESPSAPDSLEAARRETGYYRQEWERNKQERERLDAALREQGHRLDFAERRAEAALAVLGAFCPCLSSVEEMKRLYDAISPSLDSSGFTLYRVAAKMTGFDPASAFPYEDSRGLFTEADGHQLMRYLIADHFHAVDWTVVPGTCCEAATLREVNTTTPEYLAFETKLYRAVLSRMGFEDILHHEHSEEISRKDEVMEMEDKITELKLYSPLCADLFDEGTGEARDLAGGDLLPFADAIRQGIEDERDPEEAERGLMSYFDGSESVNSKVLSVFPGAEELDGELYGAAVCRVKGRLSPSELEELKEFCVSQYADGWGEGFEQRPRGTDYGELYVHFWQYTGFFILTKEEMEAERAPAFPPCQMKRGDAR